jgi:hypothetical protein
MSGLCGGVVAAAAILALAAPAGASAQTSEQHGPDDGHLLGSGAWGALQLASKLRLVPEGANGVADVAVDPRGTFAYVAGAGTLECGGTPTGSTAADVGVYVIDISDIGAPQVTGFIPRPLGARVTDGLQAVNLSTPFFEGHVLVTSSEPCGRGGKGGVSLVDVSDPLHPVPLATYGTGSARSVFAWNPAGHAYAAVVGATAVDILDITNPRRPTSIATVGAEDLAGIDQPELQLTDSRPHDVVARRFDVDADGVQEWILLLSHGAGGFVLLDVEDPSAPVVIGDTEYPAVDPQLLEAMGIAVRPDGIAHHAELTSGEQFIVGADEDLSPFAADGSFDGWGYVSLFDTRTLQLIDVYGIPEAFDPAFAVGFGSLSVNEVATDPGHPGSVYLSYNAGGLRALEVHCTDPNDGSTCNLVEVGGYLDPHGNDFWGVEAFVQGGKTYVLASDRDSGLWIFVKETN